MNYYKVQHELSLLKDLLSLVEDFEFENSGNIQELNVENFLEWSYGKKAKNKLNYTRKTIWDGKESGRSPESVISTFCPSQSICKKVF